MGKLSMMGLNTFHVTERYYNEWWKDFRRIGKQRTLRRLNQRPEGYVIDQLHRLGIDENYTVRFTENGQKHAHDLAEFLPYPPAKGEAGRYIQVIYGQFAIPELSVPQWNYEADVADRAAEAVMHKLSIMQPTRRNAAVVVAGVRLFGWLLKPGVQLIRAA